MRELIEVQGHLKLIVIFPPTRQTKKSELTETVIRHFATYFSSSS